MHVPVWRLEEVSDRREEGKPNKCVPSFEKEVKTNKQTYIHAEKHQIGTHLSCERLLTISVQKGEQAVTKCL